MRPRERKPSRVSGQSARSISIEQKSWRSTWKRKRRSRRSQCRRGSRVQPRRRGTCCGVLEFTVCHSIARLSLFCDMNFFCVNEVSPSRGSGAKSDLLPGFYKWSFIGTEPHPFVYLLSVAALEPYQQNWVVATQTAWPTKPNYLLSCPMQRKFTVPSFTELRGWYTSDDPSDHLVAVGKNIGRNSTQFFTLWPLWNIDV